MHSEAGMSLKGFHPPHSLHATDPIGAPVILPVIRCGPGEILEHRKKAVDIGDYQIYKTSRRSRLQPMMITASRLMVIRYTTNVAFPAPSPTPSGKKSIILALWS